jgi:hypothetical protein
LGTPIPDLAGERLLHEVTSNPPLPPHCTEADVDWLILLRLRPVGFSAKIAGGFELPLVRYDEKIQPKGDERK